MRRIFDNLKYELRNFTLGHIGYIVLLAVFFFGIWITTFGTFVIGIAGLIWGITRIALRKPPYIVSKPIRNTIVVGCVYVGMALPFITLISITTSDLDTLGAPLLTLLFLICAIGGVLGWIISSRTLKAPNP